MSGGTLELIRDASCGLLIVFGVRLILRRLIRREVIRATALSEDELAQIVSRVPRRGA